MEQNISTFEHGSVGGINITHIKRRVAAGINNNRRGGMVAQEV